MKPRAYFARALDAFEQAARRAGRETRDCVVGGTVVRLHFAGPALRRLFLPALAHLPTTVGPAAPRLDLCIWDGRSTGVPAPPPEWPLDAYTERGEIRAFADGEVRAAFSVDGPMLEIWDRTTCRGLVWAADHARVPWYEAGAPGRRVFSWWLGHNGLQMIHAGAVGTADGCVLLAGKGGSGKSNTALACLGAGLAYLADDYCVLEPGAVPVAHSLYGTGKVHGDDLGRLAFLEGKVANVDRLPHEKALFFLSEHFSRQLGSRAPIKAIVMPHVHPAGITRVMPAVQAEAARAVALTTIAQLPYAGTEVLSAVAGLAKRIPSFHLYIGADAADRVPAIVRALVGADAGAACA